MDNLFLLDASGFLYRSYFAIQGLSSKQGESTNALYGFIRSFLRLKEQFQPTHLIAIFDGDHSNQSRTKIYPEYKAHRTATPPDLIAQIDEARRFCALMGISILSVSGVEADDTIAAVTLWAKERTKQIYICTQDKDLAQLVEGKVSLINQHKDNLIVDEKKVEEIYGIPPTQIVDYLAIIGDASDNVPGISGFGPKTAIALLKEYGSLEKILENSSKLGGKKAITLEKEKDIAKLSQQLVTLQTDIDFPKESIFFQLKEPHWQELELFFRSKDFLSLIKIIPHATESHQKAKYHLIQDELELDALIEKLLQQHEICIDTETTSEQPLQAELVGIGLSYNEEDAYYIPMNGALNAAVIIEKLKPLFCNSHSPIGFFGHNIKYDFHILYNVGLKIEKIAFDTILASYLLNAHQRRHSLDELTLEYFGKTKIPISDLIGTGKKQITMAQVPIDRVAEYCCEDVEYTFRLKKILEKDIKKRGLEELFYDIELPLIPILAEMEQHGVYVDIPFLKTLSHDINKEITIVEQEIFALAGEEFTIGSPKQLGEILFQKLLLPIIRRGKTGPSTDADTLEQLACNYPIAHKILDYRSLEKLRSTYIDSLPHDVNPKTGRIHCQFNQSVAATGRLSCQNPNLQNIPVRTEVGRKIREAFKPQQTNYSFISADYSQIELRLLAHLTEDPGLLSAFENGVDVHSFTASQIFGIPLEEVTSEMRYRAKAVNFGVIYGQQAFGLSQELKISMKDAAQFIEQYYARYPQVKNYIEYAKETARKTGKATTLTGRERLIPEINSSNQQLRTAAERLAMNTPLQGTAADIIKIAMLRISQWLQKEQLESFLILQIHDELIFEAKDSELEVLQEGIRHYMENVFELKVPLPVQISIGKNWKEC